MKTILLTSIYLVMLVSCLLAQTIDQLSSPTSKPRVGVTVLLDGQPANQQTGLKIDNREVLFKALLDTKSTNSFKDFQPELLIKTTQILLTRGSRLLAKRDITDERSLTSLANMMPNAQPTDHITFIFTLVAQRKNGELVPLSEQPAYNFPIRE